MKISPLPSVTTVPVTPKSSSPANNSQDQQTSLNVQQARKNQQQASQNTRSAQQREEESMKRLNSAKRAEQRANRKLQEAMAEKREASQATTQPSYKGELISVMA